MQVKHELRLTSSKAGTGLSLFSTDTSYIPNRITLQHEEMRQSKYGKRKVQESIGVRSTVPSLHVYRISSSNHHSDSSTGISLDQGMCCKIHFQPQRLQITPEKEKEQ